MSRQTSNQSGGTPKWVFPAVVIGLVALVVVAAVLIAGNDDGEPENAVAEDGAQGPALPDDGEGSTSGAQVGPASIEGDPLPVYEATEHDIAVGLDAPTIIATTFDDTEVVIDHTDGTGRMIGFFAHWCSHCQREVPTVTEWVNSGGLPDGVELVGVSTAVDPGAPNYPPSEWFEREGFPGLTLRDDQASTLANGYGLPSFPYWVVVDPNGNVVARASGEQSPDSLTALAALAAGG